MAIARDHPPPADVSHHGTGGTYSIHPLVSLDGVLLYDSRGRGQSDGSPNDTLYAMFQGQPDSLQRWYFKSLNAESAWELCTGESNIVIAIVDTGVLLTRHRKTVMAEEGLLVHAGILLFLLVIECNLKVTLRQPYPGIAVYFLPAIVANRRASLWEWRPAAASGRPIVFARLRSRRGRSWP